MDFQCTDIVHGFQLLAVCFEQFKRLYTDLYTDLLVQQL